MSNSSAEESQQAYIDLIQLNNIYDYCYVIVFVLCVYDYLLTFSREVELIWRRKSTGVTVLFILNRYAVLLYQLWINIHFPHSSLVSCQANIALRVLFPLLVLLAQILFSALRIYAIWNGEWRPTLLVLSIGFIFFGIYTCTLSPKWAGIMTLPEPPHVTFCALLYSDNMQKLYNVSYICRSILDFCVLIFTWMRTYSIHKHASEAHIKASIATLILRDGTIIWGILFMLGLADIVCSNLGVLDPVQGFILTLSSMILSRFMLSLREVYLSGTGGVTSHSVGSMHLSFTSNIVGVVGAPLDHDEWRDSHIDADEDSRPPQISDNPLAAGLWEADADLDGAAEENAYEMDAITRAADAHEVDGDAEA